MLGVKKAYISMNHLCKVALQVHFYRCDSWYPDVFAHIIYFLVIGNNFTATYAFINSNKSTLEAQFPQVQQ